MFKTIIRLYSLGRTRNVNLSKSELNTLLRKMTWSIHTLLGSNGKSNNDVNPIDQKVLYKLLKVSGLENNLTPEREESLLKSLEMQMSFIQHLYDSGSTDDNCSVENKLQTFRLLHSDHQPKKPLDLQEIKKLILELSPNDEKGETGNWDVVANSKLNIEGNENTSYFTIKKNNEIIET